MSGKRSENGFSESTMKRENSENFFLETREAFNKIFNLMIFER